MNLCTSVFVYVGSIGLYKRIVNAVTQSIRICNADGRRRVIFSLFVNMLLQLLLLKRRWIQKLVFEDGGVQNISRIKIYRTLIIMNLCTSVFVYVGSIVLYKRIVNADTQSIRIANADGQGATRSNSAVCRSLRIIVV